MEKNTVLLDLGEYNEMKEDIVMLEYIQRKFTYMAKGYTLSSRQSFFFDSYKLISTDEAVKQLVGLNEVLSDKIIALDKELKEEIAKNKPVRGWKFWKTK